MLDAAADLGDLRGYQLPRIGTPRRDDLVTFGPAASRLMDLVGVELLPWQRHTLDVGMEILPNGRWRSRTNSVVVARQNGKSRGILMPRILAELFLDFGFGKPGYVIHQAQDRALPREHFMELVEKVEAVPALTRHVRKIRYTNGSESITMRNGATYTLKAPTRGAGRGPSVTLLIWDEVREQRDFAAWEAAFFTIAAQPNPQVWTVSNAGDPDSVLLNQLRDRGRAAAADPESDPSMTYLEWSADDDREITDPEGWRQANPALGHMLRPDAILEELRNVEEHGFRTERLCQWVDVAASLAVPADLWRACGVDAAPERDPESRPWLAFDIDQEGSRAVLVAVSWHSERLVAEILQSLDDGTAVDHAAMAHSILEWYRANRARAIAYDPLLGTAVANRLAAKITNPKRLVKVSGVQWYAACAQLLDQVRQRVLWHADDPMLNSDVLAATRKDVGDGAWQIVRRDAAQPIPAATALARAVHLAVKPRPVPSVH